MRLLILLFLSLATLNIQGQQKWSFIFGQETHAVKTNIITDPMKFSSTEGFGFDFANADKVVIEGSKKNHPGYCTSEQAFYFSVVVPEGAYKVKVVIGNPSKKSITSIKAEARRLMVDQKELKKGQSEELIFNVSVRSPKISETDSIRRKSREYNYMNWDNRLSLEFTGKNQAVQSIEIEPVEDVITLFLAGNSTVTDQDYEPWASWGQMITPYFNDRVVVANYAESGASLASFKSRRRLEKVLSVMKEGDYLFIEFGHNDQKRKGEGIGPWDSYTELLREFITRAREKGGIPVCVTPTQRRSFNEEGIIQYTHGDYPAAMRKLAEELDVPVIDLNEMTKVLYEAWGPELSKKAFVQYPANTFPGQDKKLEDNTHFNVFGAHEVALCVLKGMMETDIDLKNDVIHFPENYSPSCPNDPEKWTLPLSPRYESTKPDGN